MCTIKQDSYLIGFLIGLPALFTITLFYVMIIMPRDEIGFKIMECMGNDHSRLSYEECRVIILNSRKGLTPGP